MANASSSQNEEDYNGSLSPSNANGSANGGSLSTSPTGSSANISGLAKVSHAGSAFEGGNKIAFDPKDLEREDEEVRSGGRMPKLTIMEEVLLLGLKDKQVRT